MNSGITGIHHVSAITSQVQQNIDFYSKILGLKLVKQTVNYDNPEVYHFYYGNQNGNPGSLLTFFPYLGLVGGRHGKGMMNTLGFSLPENALDYWLNRLGQFKIPFKEPIERFKGEVVVYFEDYDGLGLELVFTAGLQNQYPVEHTEVPSEFGISEIYHTELWVEKYETTAGILNGFLDFEMVNSSGNRFRFKSSKQTHQYVDVICTPDSLKGLSGTGSYHHIAFNISTEEELNVLQEKLKSSGLHPTQVLDRNYFKSVYFREPGGVLFEIATALPGFTVDESLEELGSQLQLPPQFKSQRDRLMQILPPFEK